MLGLLQILKVCSDEYSTCVYNVLCRARYPSLTAALDLHRDHSGGRQPVQGGGDLLTGKFN